MAENELLGIIAETLRKAEKHNNGKKDPSDKEYNRWAYFLTRKKTKNILTGAWQRLQDGELPSNEVTALQRIFLTNRHNYDTKTECLRTYITTTCNDNIKAFYLNLTKEAIDNPENVSRLPQEKRDYKRENFPKILEHLGLEEKPGLEDTYMNLLDNKDNVNTNVARFGISYSQLSKRIKQQDRFKDKPLIQSDLYDAVRNFNGQSQKDDETFNKFFLVLMRYSENRIDQMFDAMEKYGLTIEETGLNWFFKDSDLYDNSFKEQSKYFFNDPAKLDEYLASEKNQKSLRAEHSKLKHSVSRESQEQSLQLLYNHLNNEPLDYFCCMRDEDPNTKAARQRAYKPFLASINQSPENLEKKLDLIHDSQVDFTCLPSRILTQSYDKIKEKLAEYK